MLLKRIAWIIASLFLLASLALLVAYWTSSNSCDENVVAQGEKMKAIVYCDYGSPDVLRYQEIEKPAPASNEILVKIHAAAANPLDWHYMRGLPYIIRLFNGLRKPEDIRMGVDYAGTVQAVGSNVTRFKPGDEVFGASSGAFAQYVTTPEDRAVVLKPANLTFAQAAAIPIAAVTALQGLRDKGKVQPGQKVLINGSSGGVGTFAVQIAKSFGATVTGVSSGRNHAMVYSIGADHMIDYTKEDFTQGAQRYDVIFDLVGNHSLGEYKGVMKSDGILVMSGGAGLDGGQWVAPFLPMLQAALMSPFVSQHFANLLAELNKQELTVLADLIQKGKVTPVIDRSYKLEDTAAAIRYLETGRARGKVIITMD